MIFGNLLQTLTNSFGFLILVVAVVANTLLAFAVIRVDHRNATNITYFLLSIFMIFWLSTYVAFFPIFSEYATQLVRLGFFFAAPMSMMFFLFAHTFPSKTLKIDNKTFSGSLVVTILIMILNLSPWAIERASISSGNFDIQTGAGLLPFSIISTLFSIFATYFLIRKLQDKRPAVRHQVKMVLTGIILMLALIIVTVLAPILIFGSGLFVSLLPAYTIVFLGLTAYAVVKHHLFNVKVIATEALTAIIWITLFAKIFVAETLIGQLVDSLIFLVTVFFGISLIRSVRKEVKQREEIQKLASNLEIANQEQQSLIHFITHQVKGFITKSRNIFAGILEEDYGPVSDELKPIIQAGFKSDTDAVETVQQILQASNLRKGTVELKNELVDIKGMVLEEVTKQKGIAEKKGLTLETSIDEQEIKMMGDKGQLEHVVHNLIDNSVKYTLKGSVIVNLHKYEDKIRFSVKDTGVGITEEDMKRLFTEGGRGKDSQKVNVESTGYGLFIVKNIVEKHKGKVWAESGGEGKGSEFIVEIPLG